MNKYEGFINKLNRIEAKKLAVVGSRGFGHEKEVTDQIKLVVDSTKIDTIVSGGAKGIDTYAEQWADKNGLNKIIHLAEWDKYGNSAGYRRNIDIINDADAVMVFWKDNSPGTKISIDLAKKEDKPTFVNQIVVE